MMPTLHSSAVMTPGQLGPISVQSLPLMYSRAITMSFTGMPSVMQTITLMPASAASMIASAANGGGTKMMLTSAAVAFTASLTVSNTGLSKCFCPPLPGVTPPTTLVPYSIICVAWKVPSLPVKPWTITLLCLLTSTLMFRSAFCDDRAAKLLMREETFWDRPIGYQPVIPSADPPPSACAPPAGTPARRAVRPPLAPLRRCTGQ